MRTLAFYIRELLSWFGPSAPFLEALGPLGFATRGHAQSLRRADCCFVPVSWCWLEFVPRVEIFGREIDMGVSSNEGPISGSSFEGFHFFVHIRCPGFLKTSIACCFFAGLHCQHGSASRV